jgi:hypothetical protein
MPSELIQNFTNGDIRQAFGRPAMALMPGYPFLLKEQDFMQTVQPTHLALTMCVTVPPSRSTGFSRIACSGQERMQLPHFAQNAGIHACSSLSVIGRFSMPA